MELFSCLQATLSPQIGPLAQHIHRFGPLGLSPRQYSYGKDFINNKIEISIK